MRILFVLHQFYPEFSGGTERVVLNLARCAQRAGHYVHVLACTMRESPASQRKASGALGGAYHEVYQGLPVTLIPRSQLPASGDLGFDVAPAMVEQVRDWMRAERFELVHVFHAMRMSSALMAAQQCGLPYVVTLTDFFVGCYRINAINAKNMPCAGPEEGRACGRDCLVSPWSELALLQRHQLAKALLQGASECVVPSEYVADFFRAAFPDCHWRVIPHGIDFLSLAAPGVDTSVPQASAEGIVTLGYLGSIVPQKGLHVLLQALSCVPSSRLRLRVVGGFYGDPVYGEDIRKMIASDPRVEWVGQVEPAEVAGILKSMDLLCLPSIVPSPSRWCSTKLRCWGCRRWCPIWARRGRGLKPTVVGRSWQRGTCRHGRGHSLQSSMRPTQSRGGGLVFGCLIVSRRKPSSTSRCIASWSHWPDLALARSP